MRGDPPQLRGHVQFQLTPMVLGSMEVRGIRSRTPGLLKVFTETPVFSEQLN